MKTHLLLPLVLTLTISGCGSANLFGNPMDKTQTQVVRVATDEVKLIQEGQKSGISQRSMKLSSYPLAQKSRLLLRLSTLKKESWNILDQQALLLKLEIKPETTPASMSFKEYQAQARAAVKICPVTKNWMMLATWDKAHPYRSGGWNFPGGDFDVESCFASIPTNDPRLANDEEAVFCQGENKLCFDLMPWFQSYIRERQADMGLIVINESSQEIAVMGDATLQGPTVLWRRFR